jgi:LmbE family N-acetylglucosaminyl deacetylase
MPRSPSRRLAGVFAHPDDDTFSLAGTLASAPEPIAYGVIVATSGEAGRISDPALATPETLAEVREEEERAALREMGAGDADIRFLRYTDGALASVARAELVGAIAEGLQAPRPQVVVTFGPEGITGHTDHIAVGQAATEAFHDVRAGQEDAPDGAFRRLLYVAVPQARLDAYWRMAAERGLDVGSPDDPFQPRGVPDHTVTVRVDVRSGMDAKLAAIRSHRTQSEEMASLPDDVAREVFGEECFVQAWPPITDPDVRILRNPFERLED